MENETMGMENGYDIFYFGYILEFINGNESKDHNRLYDLDNFIPAGLFRDYIKPNNSYSSLV
jgi:hypothetical protein